MKFIFGLVLIVLIAEKGDADEEVSRKIKSFRYPKQSDKGVQFFKAERVFVPADPDSSAPTKIALEQFNAPKGYGVNYIEVLESLNPEYAGADLGTIAPKVPNPTRVQVIFTNSAGKGIDVRVLYYVYKF